jgi:hypothetical protein
VADLLGKGQPVTKDCAYAGALIERDRIKVRYECASSPEPVVVELRHRDAFHGELAHTEQFSLHAEAGKLPAEFRDALLTRIRSKESGWSWGTEPSVSPQPTPPTASPIASSSSTPAIPHPWLILVAAVLLGAARWNAPKLPRGDVWVALALAAACLIARFGLGPWGPFHMNGQGPLWVMGAAWDARRLAQYGPGYPELFASAASLFARHPDYAIFAANACLSASIPVAAFAAARLGGMDRVRACLAAALLCVDPVALRMGATESYLVPMAALCTGATLAFMASTSEGVAGRFLQAVLLSLVGSLLCAQTLRIHPYGWAPAALCALSSIAVAHDKGARVRLKWVAASYGICGSVALAANAALLRTVGEHALQQGSRMGVLEIRPQSILDTTFVVLSVAILIGVFVARPRWLLVPAAAALADLALTQHFHTQSWIQHVASQRLHSPMIVVGLVALLPQPWLQRRSPRVVAFASTIALLVVFLPIVRERTTEHLEYRWLRPRLASLPSSCSLAYVSRADNRVLYLPEYAASGRSAQHPLTIEMVRGEELLNTFLSGQCTYLLTSSLCSSVSGRARCEELERGTHLVLADRTTLPALPTHDNDPFDRPEVEVALWRVQSRPGGL